MRIRHKRSLIGTAALALLLAPSLASAQEPPSLALAQQPDVGAAAQESRDIAGRWLGATDTAIQEFGKVGGTLTNASLSQFAGVSKAISWADKAAPVGAALGGDYRGAISGAVAIKVGALVTSGTAALFGGGGTAAGFIAVGTLGGAVVGGAVATAAGGFIAALAYDKYIKDSVAKGVLAGITAVLDPLPIAEMRSRMDALMLQAMSPEQRVILQTSATFGGGEVQLLDFGALGPMPTLKQPATTDQQQAALPPATALPPMTHFEITNEAGNAVNDCRVNGDQVTCALRWLQSLPMGVTSNRAVITGRLSGATMIGTETHQITNYYWGSKCTGTDTATGPVTFTFDSGGTARIKSGPYRVTHTGCSKASIWPSGEATVQWRVLQ